MHKILHENLFNQLHGAHRPQLRTRTATILLKKIQPYSFKPIGSVHFDLQ